VARNPDSRDDFHRVPDYPRYDLGYEETDLDALPTVTLERFTGGVGNRFAVAEIRRRETVLDLGCGSGTVLLIAARRVGAQGRVIGVDTPRPCIAGPRWRRRRPGWPNGWRSGRAAVTPSPSRTRAQMWSSPTA